MIDIHNHILWGIDDGAKHEEMTIEMLKIAASQEIHGIITTPHFMDGQNAYTKEEYREKITSVQALADTLGVSIKLYTGNEVYIDPFLDRLWEERAFFTLADSRYVLVEFPMMGIPDYAEDALYRLQLKGLIPIIAHPERYVEVQKDPNYLHRYLDKGCLAQVNGTSITGRMGKMPQETVRILLEHDMIHFIGSDAHSDGGRAPKLQWPYKMAAEWIGEQSAAQLCNNPEAILSNQEMGWKTPRVYKRAKKKIFSIQWKKILGM